MLDSPGLLTNGLQIHSLAVRGSFLWLESSAQTLKSKDRWSCTSCENEGSVSSKIHANVWIVPTNPVWLQMQPLYLPTWRLLSFWTWSDRLSSLSRLNMSSLGITILFSVYKKVSMFASILTVPVFSPLWDITSVSIKLDFSVVYCFFTASTWTIAKLIMFAFLEDCKTHTFTDSFAGTHPSTVHLCTLSQDFNNSVESTDGSLFQLRTSK